MKLAPAAVSAFIAFVAVPAAAQGYDNYGNYVAPGMLNANPGIRSHGFSDARPPPSYAAPTFGPSPTPSRAVPSRSAFAPETSPPDPPRFKPFGDRSGMAGGGPGAYPSAPKPKGYVDIYGDKPSEHLFAY